MRLTFIDICTRVERSATMKRAMILTVCAALAVSFGFTSHIALAQSLDGNWVITSVIDNGRVVAPNDVQLTYAADGRVVISGQQVELMVPMTYQKKRLA